MKTSTVRQCSIGIAVGLAFFLGCAKPSAQTEPQKPIVSPVTSPADNPVAPAALGNTPPPAPVAVADTNAPAIIERIPPTARPESVATSSGIAEVAKLAQAGVGEQVMLAYVEKYNGRFEVGADQIVYLNDLGVSSTVITAMLKHDVAKDPAATATQPAPAPAQEVAVAQPPSDPPPTTSVAPPPTSTEVSYFYDSLSPYGSWIYLAGYGWCWQPTIAVSVSTWRPYCDSGSWYWSDGGWYWNSDYSWGWAAFHYGRWYHHSGCGWVWTPGLTWGPSWVSWRYQNGYCGWAPLPPEAHYVHGVGFTYRGAHVSVGFEFGLTAFHYSFVHADRFCDPAPYRHVIARPAVVNIYKNTTVVNNYVVGNNNTVINRGVGREIIARTSGSARIREVAVRETPLSNFAAGHGQKIERQGNQLVAYRPQLPATPPAVRTAPTATRGHAGGSIIAKPGTGGSGNSLPPNTTSRSQPGVGSRANTEAVRTQPGANTPSSNPNAGREQTAPRNATPAPGTGQPQQRQPQQQPKQQRTETTLFGNPLVTRGEQKNNPPAALPPARTGQQQQRQPQQIVPRTEQNYTVQQNRTPPNNPYQSPRQYEQAPRYSPPAQSGNAAQHYSQPSTGARTGQERSVPATGSQGSSGSGQQGHGERVR